MMFAEVVGLAPSFPKVQSIELSGYGGGTCRPRVCFDNLICSNDGDDTPGLSSEFGVHPASEGVVSSGKDATGEGSNGSGHDTPGFEGCMEGGGAGSHDSLVLSKSKLATGFVVDTLPCLGLGGVKFDFWEYDMVYFHVLDVLESQGHSAMPSESETIGIDHVESGAVVGLGEHEGVPYVFVWFSHIKFF